MYMIMLSKIMKYLIKVPCRNFNLIKILTQIFIYYCIFLIDIHLFAICQKVTNRMDVFEKCYFSANALLYVHDNVNEPNGENPWKSI